MNLNLARKTIHDRWRNTLFYGIGLVAYTLMITAIYPSFSNIPDIDKLLESYPEDLLRLFGGSQFDLTNFNSYINVEFLGLMLVIIMGAYVFTFARSVTAGEIRDGTMELLVTQPVERREIVATKSAVMLAGIAALMVSTAVSIIAFGAMFDVGASYSGLAAYMPVAIALFFCIGGYSVLTGVLVPRHGAMAAVGITIALYLMNFIGESVKSVRWIRYASIFHYYNPADVLDKGSVPWIDVLVLAAVGLVSIIAAAYIFQHRDITL